MARRSSSRLQKAATLPSLRISTWSQHSSTSRSRCEESSRRRSPRSRISWMSWIMRARAGGSSPLVGSSRNSSLGPWAMACASLAACFMPSEYVPMRAVAHLAQPHVEESLVGALQGVLRRQAGQLRHQPHEVDAGHGGDVGVVLRHVADQAADLARVGADVAAQDARRARRRLMKPQQGVDAGSISPAPFGPSRPTDRPVSAAFSFFRMTRGPKRTSRPSSSMTGSITYQDTLAATRVFRNIWPRGSDAGHAARGCRSSGWPRVGCPARRRRRPW